MLVEFSVGNFRSYYEPISLSLLAAPLHASDKRLDQENTFEVCGQRLLRSATIYGANASGKSNLVRALRFMRDLVCGSSKESQAGEPIGVERFRLNAEAVDQPAYFQIVFWLDDVRYRYGFEVDEQRVHSEWLYHARQRETRLFVRDGEDFDLSGGFKEGRGLEMRTRPNALFLSVVAQFNGKTAIDILTWFSRQLVIVSGLSDAAYGTKTVERLERDESFRQRTLHLVREADLSISGLRVERLGYGGVVLSTTPVTGVGEAERLGALRETGMVSRRVQTQHQVFDGKGSPAGWVIFELDEQESKGTQKMVYLAGPLMETLDEGKVLVVDELDARLHPLITRVVVELFHSSETNPHNGQLISTTHDTSLLRKEYYRRDQVWFAEKDRYGATDLYSLAELKVRNDASFDKDYVAGKYGAVPLIGGLRGLFEVGADGETA
jgi:hypothetical protein